MYPNIDFVSNLRKVNKLLELRKAQGIRECSVRLYKLNTQILQVYSNFPSVNLEKLVIADDNKNNILNSKYTIPNGLGVLERERKQTSDIYAGTITHTLGKSCKCTYCGNSFSTRPALYRHIGNVHNITKLYNCTSCNKNFVTRGELTVPIRTHTGGKPHKCQLCLKQFSLPSRRKYHSSTHTGKKSYKCKFCAQQFGTPRKRFKHIFRHHKKFKGHHCSFCDKSFLTKIGLTEHISTHTGEKPYKCEICYKRFAGPRDLPHHIKKVHNKIKSIDCPMCTKQFFSMGHLNIHLRTHTGEKPYPCTLRPKLLQTQGQLTQHRQYKHPSYFELKCSFCDQRFPVEKSLKRHISKEHFLEQNEFRCIFCETKFTADSFLKDHIQTHLNEKTPYKCSVCDQSFLNSLRRRLHIRNVHVKGKCHKCDVCDKAFFSAAALRNHLKAHTVMNLRKAQNLFEVYREINTTIWISYKKLL